MFKRAANQGAGQRRGGACPQVLVMVRRRRGAAGMEMRSLPVQLGRLRVLLRSCETRQGWFLVLFLTKVWQCTC